MVPHSRNKTADLERLRKELSERVLVPDSEWNWFCSELVARQLEQGESFIGLETPPCKLGFVLSGLFKVVGQVGNRLVTYQLVKEGAILSSFGSMIRAESKSDLAIVAIESSQILEIDFQVLRQRAEFYECWRNLIQKLTEHYALTWERRCREYYSLTLEERFSHFVTKHRNLIGRVSQRVIASYLDASPEAFSRVRARLRSKRRSKGSEQQD